VLRSHLVTQRVCRARFPFGDYDPSVRRKPILSGHLDAGFLLTVRWPSAVPPPALAIIESAEEPPGIPIKTRLGVGALMVSFQPCFIAYVWGFFVLNGT
jgi:hypothetical protein